MPGVVRTAVDIGDGEDDDGCDPCPYDLGSTDVFVEGFNVIRVNDRLTCGGYATGGADRVYANFRLVHLRGLSTSCGGVAITGSNRVFANGG